MAIYINNRAAFVQQEYRNATAINTAVLSRNGSAREVEITTQLDEDSAQALADAILAENNDPRTFEVEIEGVMFLDKLIGSCPSFLLNSTKFAAIARMTKLVGYTTDYEAKITTLQVRG